MLEKDRKYVQCYPENVKHIYVRVSLSLRRRSRRIKRPAISLGTVALASSQFLVNDPLAALFLSCFRPALLLSYSLSNKMMFFKSLAIAAGIAFAAISSVCATPAEAADVSQSYTYVQEKSLVYVLEKTKYEITPVVHKFRE